LFKPQSTAYTDIWLDGEKAATVEYWQGDIEKWDIQKLMRHDSGTGIILKDKVKRRGERC